jgi:serine/threonine protein kinase
MAVSPIFCGHCGAQNPASEYFCFSCGYTLSASATTASPSFTMTGMLPAHTLLRQRYRVLRVVGQGGMGAVYLAQDTSLGDRLVAIKEMSQSNTQQSQEAIENFKREAHLLAGLQHPNLPSIYDHFEENGRWYLVMSFIQGETLEDYLSHAPGHKLPLEEVLQIGQELCNVLNYLHTHQPPIIFRDLKPGNVMRTTDGHMYLIDFGIARHFKPGQAKDTANYGSAGYAPPEQYGKAQTTERSDIYSLGVTLYEMLSGYDPSQSPFTLPPLQSLVPTLPDRLVKLITQMLEMDASKRPESVKVVQQELQQASIPPSILGQYVQARPNMPIRPPSTRSSALKRRGPQPISLASAQSRQIHIQQGCQQSPVQATSGNIHAKPQQEYNAGIRVLYFLLVGWWLGFVCIEFGLLLCMFIVTWPEGLLILKRLPHTMTLRPSIPVRVNVSTQQKRSTGIRVLYFLLVGWWLGLYCLEIGLILCMFIVTWPEGLLILKRLPYIMTLQ